MLLTAADYGGNCDLKKIYSNHFF